MRRIFRFVAVAAVLAPLAACSNSAPTDPTDGSVEARRVRLQEASAAEPTVSFRPATTGRGGRGGRR